MLNPTITLLSNALATEIMEMKDIVTGETITDMYDGEGGISIPITQQPLTPKYTHSSVIEMRDFTRKINSDCVKLPIKLGETLKFLSKLCQDDTNATIYGAIWVHEANHNIRLNLLHPVIAYSVLNNLFNIDLESKGTVYIYEWNNLVKGMGIDTELAPEYVGVWENVFSSLSSKYQPKVSHKVTTDLRAVTRSVREGRNLSELKVIASPSGNNPQCVMTPVHLYTDGLLYPYYGVVHSETRGSGTPYVSRDLTPLGSCNVNHDRHSITNWGGTCTGTRSNSVYGSLRVLSNANTGSPHHLDTIFCDLSEIKTFVKITQEYACVFIDNIIKNTYETSDTDTSTDNGEGKNDTTI